MEPGSQPRHVFRFFVEAPGSIGARVPLSSIDARHARVLRLALGDPVEVVDAAGITWEASYGDDGVELLTPLPSASSSSPTRIELVAGALVGGRFDELVDGAVQAGASLVVPFADTRRDAERLAARRARLQRIARAAAKQAKRDEVPDVAEPIDLPALRALDAGIILDPGAPELLDAVVRDASRAGDALRLLVGPAEGLSAELVLELAELGWRRGRLGPTILRAELAAPVAVAIAAMHA